MFEILEIKIIVDMDIFLKNKLFLSKCRHFSMSINKNCENIISIIYYYYCYYFLILLILTIHIPTFYF